MTATGTFLLSYESTLLLTFFVGATFPLENSPTCAPNQHVSGGLCTFNALVAHTLRYVPRLLTPTFQGNQRTLLGFRKHLTEFSYIIRLARSSSSI